MSYGYQPAPRRSGMTTAGKWMFIIGLILSILAGITAAWGTVQTISYASSIESESVSLAGGPQSVQMDQGDTRMVFSEGNPSEISCTVTLPDGSTTGLTAPDATQQDAVEGMGEAGGGLVGVHAATTTGEHEFACEGGSAMLTPGLGAGEIMGVLAATVGFLALLPMGLLTIIGLILWLVGRGKDRRAREQGQVGYGQAHPGHGYGTASYGGDSTAYGSTQDYPQPGQGYGQASPPPPVSGQASPPPPPGYGQSGGATPGNPSDPYASPGDDDERRDGDGTRS